MNRMEGYLEVFVNNFASFRKDQALSFTESDCSKIYLIARESFINNHEMLLFSNNLRLSERYKITLQSHYTRARQKALSSANDNKLPSAEEIENKWLKLLKLIPEVLRPISNGVMREVDLNKSLDNYFNLKEELEKSGHVEECTVTLNQIDDLLFNDKDDLFIENLENLLKMLVVDGFKCEIRELWQVAKEKKEEEAEVIQKIINLKDPEVMLKMFSELGIDENSEGLQDPIVWEQLFENVDCPPDVFFRKLRELKKTDPSKETENKIAKVGLHTMTSTTTSSVQQDFAPAQQPLATSQQGFAPAQQSTTTTQQPNATSEGAKIDKDRISAAWRKRDGNIKEQIGYIQGAISAKNISDFALFTVFEVLGIHSSNDLSNYSPLLQQFFLEKRGVSFSDFLNRYASVSPSTPKKDTSTPLNSVSSASIPKSIWENCNSEAEKIELLKTLINDGTVCNRKLIKLMKELQFNEISSLIPKCPEISSLFAEKRHIQLINLLNLESSLNSLTTKEAECNWWSNVIMSDVQNLDLYIFMDYAGIDENSELFKGPMKEIFEGARCNLHQFFSEGKITLEKLNSRSRTELGKQIDVTQSSSYRRFVKENNETINKFDADFNRISTEVAEEYGAENFSDLIELFVQKETEKFTIRFYLDIDGVVNPLKLNPRNSEAIQLMFEELNIQEHDCKDYLSCKKIDSLFFNLHSLSLIQNIFRTCKSVANTEVIGSTTWRINPENQKVYSVNEIKKMFEHYKLSEYINGTTPLDPQLEPQMGPTYEEEKRVNEILEDIASREEAEITYILDDLNLKSFDEEFIHCEELFNEGHVKQILRKLIDHLMQRAKD